MRIHGQRWQYRVGNALVHVDNAFSWTGWGQERLVVNLETVKATGAWMALRRSFAEPWLTRIGDDELQAQLKARLLGIDCCVTLAGEALEAEELFEAKWSGPKGTWPPEESWTPTKQLSFGLKSRRPAG
jgi:hypothetical protein